MRLRGISLVLQFTILFFKRFRDFSQTSWGSTKLLGYILLEPQISVPNFTAIHTTAILIIHSGPTCYTDVAIPRATQVARLKQSKIHTD